MIKKNIFGLFIIVTFFSTNFSYGKYVAIGHAKTSDAEVTTELIKQVFERNRFNVATKNGPVDLMFDMLAEREIDLFVGGRLTTTHKKYWEKHKNKIIPVGLLVAEGSYFFGVPSYLPKQNIKSISDLVTEANTTKFNKEILILKSDLEMLPQAQKAMTEYQLSQNGFMLKKLSEKEYVETIQKYWEKKETFVIGMRRPYYLNHSLKIRKLEDPESTFYSSTDAYLIANKESWDYIKKVHRTMLKRIEISVKSVEEMDYAVRVKKVPVHDVARRWMGAHPYTVEYWLEPDME